jgi:hypothetical protein
LDQVPHQPPPPHTWIYGEEEQAINVLFLYVSDIERFGGSVPGRHSEEAHF